MRFVKYQLFLVMVSTQFVHAQPASLDHLIAEPAYSTIQFSIPIANGLTRVTGKFNFFNVEIDLVDNDITKSRVKASIKVSSLNTGNASRDHVLMSNLFFDEKKFPEIIFTSERIEKNKDGFIVFGQFEMHGVTRPVELPFTITGTIGDEVIGFASRYSLLRSAFNIGNEYRHAKYENFINNEVDIEINFWTKRRPRENR